MFSVLLLRGMLLLVCLFRGFVVADGGVEGVDGTLWGEKSGVMELGR